MMDSQVSILVVEDSEDDFLLLVREIEKGGFDIDVSHASDENELNELLSSRKWDIVLTDYNMPGFNGIRALEIVRRTDRDLPCIMISGKMGEETAVEAMRSGADDFILKGRYSRLIPAITRSLRSARIRQLKKDADKKLLESRENISALLNVNDNYFFIVSPDGRIIDANRALCTKFNVSSDEIVGMSMRTLLPDNYQTIEDTYISQILNDKREVRFIEKVGERYLDTTLYPVVTHSGIITRIIVLARDVTDDKRMEAALAESEERFRGFVEQAYEGFSLVDNEGRIIVWNRALELLTGLPRDEAMGGYLWDVQHQVMADLDITGTGKEWLREYTQQALRTGCASF